MIKFEMEKLVRDKIPHIIEGQGGVITRRTLGKKEFFRELQVKLAEETTACLEDSGFFQAMLQKTTLEAKKPKVKASAK